MREISKKISKWYELNKRQLPWRNTPDPYFIWLSETILQQTRVVQGLPYYQRFTEKYPTVARLAEANGQEVLRMWQGLGYYSRARNLLKCAVIVQNEYGGKFPEDEKSLQKLPGIGPYTAAAIASIAFNKETPVLDGNVYRLLARLYCIDKPINQSGSRNIFLEAAKVLIAGHPQPGNHNQAMMELGATICTPVNPQCNICPVSQYCCAKKLERQNTLPVKLPKRKSRNRYFHYFYIQQGQGLFLNKRGPGDIWENLYELPLLETDAADAPAPQVLQKKFTNNCAGFQLLSSVKHILTHQNINASFYKIDFKSAVKLSDVIFVPFNELDNYPLPRLIDRFLKNICNLAVKTGKKST